MAKKEKSNFTSWEQVDSALCEITKINSRVMAAQAQMEADKLIITNAYEQKVRDDFARKKQLEKDMKLFAEEHIDEFEKSKSKQLIYGKIWFEKKTDIVVRNVKAIIEACKQHKMFDCIKTNTKVTESLDKDALKLYDDNALKVVGANRKIYEEYKYEVPESKLEG